MLQRRAFFAGSWYPADPARCRSQVESFFQEAPRAPAAGGHAVGGIVPHAGWKFSGRISGQVVRLLQSGDPPDTVVLFGGHLGPRDPHALMGEGAWETPLGPMEVDVEAAQTLRKAFPLRSIPPLTAEPDNTLEIPLPFIKHAFPEARVLPLAVAANSAAMRLGERCGAVLRETGKKTRVVGSTDLTHYGPGYGFAPVGLGPASEKWVVEVSDRAVVRQMMEMNPEGILEEAARSRNACCPGAVAAAVACMRELGADSVQLVASGTSREVFPGDDFVGYAGLVYWTSGRGSR